MRWKFWGKPKPGLSQQVADLRNAVSTLTAERNVAVDESRKLRSAVTMTRVGSINVDPVQLTASMRRIVPDIRVEMLGYQLVIMSNHVLTEAELNGIEAVCPFTIDPT